MAHRISQQRISSHCSTCFEKQLRIDALEEEIANLKNDLNRQERLAKEGYFGSSTPSSKIPIKANTEKQKPKKRGAKPGHSGNSRKSHAEDEIDKRHEVCCDYENCPDCGNKLENKGFISRSILESPPKKAEKISYRIQKKYCCKCHKSYQKQPPGVLKKSLYGNQLITNMAEMHYLHGIPIGRISELTGVGDGAIVAIFKRLAGVFSKVKDQLIAEYRQSEVKHADETGWRTDGKNGYTWLFATDKLSLFYFGETRSAKTPKSVFGDEKLPGVLVVDRYAGYNKVPCDVQYCYSHLMRDVEDLQKRHPGNAEIETFIAVLIPLLATAIKLRKQPISDDEFRVRAQKLELEIKEIMNNPAKHLGIKRIQELFRDKEKRLYHWAKNRKIPAENNLAERDIRPTVIARKVSFGSGSEEGAKTRSILTTVLHTLKKRYRDPTAKLKTALDMLAQDENLDPVAFLFNQGQEN